jgi:hypothetical protein
VKQRILVFGVALLALAGLARLTQQATPIALGQAREGQFDAPTGGGGTLSIAGASFVPGSSDTVYLSDATGGMAVTGSGDRTMHAPVLLPDGAQLVSIRFHYLDDTPSSAMTARLVRNNDATLGQRLLLATAQSPPGVSGYSNTYASVSPSVAKIDNAHYNYELEIYWEVGSADLKAMGVKVYYTNP